MKRIALLITGGTIGMTTKEGESNVPADINEQLNYQELNDLTPEDVSITSHVLCYKDSSSIGVDVWQLIINKISDLANDNNGDNNADKYDAFIVSHGTDTMAYSSAAVAYYFGKNLPCPIVFTGSCRSPDVPDTDAWTNLQDAVKVACSNIGEVVVVFAGKVWRASRTIKVASADDAIFTTPGLAPLAEADASTDALKINPHCYLADAKAKLKHVPASAFSFSDKLLFINAMPALDTAALKDLAQSPEWKLCLIQGMGAGNLTDELITFVETSIKKHKHIVIMPAQLSPITSIYPPLKNALALGALVAEGYSMCSLWVKLSWLVAKIDAQPSMDYLKQKDMLKQELSKDFVGEVILP